MNEIKLLAVIVIGLIIISVVAAVQYSAAAGIFIMMFVLGLLLLKIIEVLAAIQNKRL